MKRVIIIASAAFGVNLLAGLLLSAYALTTLLFTSLAIVINCLLVCALFAFGAESTHRLSLGMCFLGLGVLEFVSAFFAPQRWTDNWWVIAVVALTALQAIVTYLAIHYSRQS